MGREGRVVLPAGKTLFLSCSDDPAVFEQRGGAVMIVGGYTQNIQGTFLLDEEMKNTALLIISTIVGLYLIDYAARHTLNPSSLYSSFHTVPELNQWHNEVSFWERYKGEPDKANFASYDPVLGWEPEASGDGIRGSTKVTPEPESGVTRIVALGDSFVYGTDVAADENFAAILDARAPEIEVLNMGVPGYGIDQAYLKYLHLGATYQPHVVVLGIYVSDYERSSVAFTTFAKPKFVETTEGFVVANQPVPEPLAELNRISRALEGKSYLLETLRNGWRKLTTGAAEREAFFNKTDRTVTHILKSLKDGLGEDQQLLIVHIPRAETFIEQEAFRNEMSRRLLAIYAALQLNTIDLSAEFISDATPSEVYQTHYFHRPNGSVGHLSPLGHQKVADLIAARLRVRPGTSAPEAVEILDDLPGL